MQIDITFAFSAGSMPPPYHDEYEITIHNQAGEIQYWPDYPGGLTPMWKMPFAVDTSKVSALYQQVKDLLEMTQVKVTGITVGGSQQWAHGKVDGMDFVVQPDQANDAWHKCYENIKLCVPESIWADLAARRSTFWAAAE